ncbi:P-loop containing nucleoside triphosphate hydrolase protein [Hypoxylon sp. NC1633]|nr:P-loop containing nucleoside triphosphate hydrolase protein [Hypoxylon sp. NC1633]
MSRAIDELPTPTHIEPKKLIVLSAPRTGTHGLYAALKQLGFRPFHMIEIVKSGPKAIRIMNDAQKADLFLDGKPYGRAEFDKWFADYDIIIEMPFFMLHSLVRAYPEAKFFLTERNPEKWATSFASTVGWAATKFRTFPMSVFLYFDAFASCMSSVVGIQVAYFSNGHWLTPEGRKYLVENYREYIAEVKQIVPPQQLTVVRLEDGLGWDDICPLLGVPVPDFKWPALNTPEEFAGHMGPVMKRVVRKGLIGTTFILASFIAVGLWYLKRMM